MPRKKDMIPKPAKIKKPQTKRIKSPKAKKPKGASKLMMKSSMGMRDR